jgi:capsular exopolysaccharide synthesis family protein
MKVSKNADIETGETNLLQQLVFRYLPYWPVFVLLLICSAGTAFLYLKYKAPLYEITATILVKDEKRGLDDSKVLDALNLFGAKKIVENEIEVLHSRSIISQVATDLQLYAPVDEKSGILFRSAYITSPVIIRLENPDSLNEVERISFNYIPGSNVIMIDNKTYSMNQLVASPWGNIRFSENPLYAKTAIKKPFFFSLVSLQKIVNDLQNSLEILPSNKLSTVININLEDAIPQRGEAILNELINDYNRASIDDKNMMASNTLEFVEKRLHLMANELDEMETGIQKFRTRNGVVDISQQSSQYLQNVGENDQKLSEMDVQLSVLDQIEKYIESKNGQPGLVPTTFGITDPLLSQLLEKLYDSEIQYEKLQKTTAEDNPILISVRNEIARLKPSILENIKNQRKSIEAARNSLIGTSSRYNAMLNTLPEKERELVEISRQQTIKNSIYSFLLQKKEEAALSFNSAVADSRLIDKAESSIKPVSPKHWIVYLIALLLPFPLLASLISLKEMARGKILFRHSIEERSVIPVIGELAFDKSGQLLVTDKNERTLITEQFRNMRSTISNRLLKAKGKKIMVTSSISGEGKSFVACNLANVFAQAGKKVVLLEADMYKPKISSVFNLSHNTGLSNNLMNEKSDDLLLRSSIHPSRFNNNLFVIPAGNVPDNPSELLMNDKMDILMKSLENMYEIIIIDAVPINPVSDAYLISKFADITLFVVRHAVTSKINVQMLDEDMEMQRLKNVNIVFNGIKKRGYATSGYGYEFGYGYTSSIGYGYFSKSKAKKKYASKHY